MKRCPNNQCSKHRIRLINGLRGKYCPVCGKETVNISLCLFRLYIHKTGLGLFSAALVVSVVIMFWVNPACQRRADRINAESQQAAKLLTDMPTAWHRLFISLTEVPGHKRYEVLSELHKMGKLTDLEPIDADQLQVVLRLFNTFGNTNTVDEVMKLLADQIIITKAQQ